DLVRPEGGVHRARPVVRIQHVVQRARVRVPEPGAEGAQAVREGARPALGVRGGDGERVEPQGLHLDRLADARRDHVIADARVHPGERGPRLPAASSPSRSRRIPGRAPAAYPSTIASTADRSTRRSPDDAGRPAAAAAVRYSWTTITYQSGASTLDVPSETAPAPSR